MGKRKNGGKIWQDQSKALRASWTSHDGRTGKILRRAAEASHKSLTDFMLDSAYQAAEQTLLDQRLFMVSGSKYQTLLKLLERPAKNNARLKRFFSKPAPWERR